MGEADGAAVWSGYDGTTQAWLTFYGEVFVRGRILATVRYACNPATVDGSVLGCVGGGAGC